jgi:pyruvate,water dikinase
MSELLVKLSEVGRKNIALVGGKAASLGEMIKVGIPVPPGFVITTKAYSEGMTDQLKNEIYRAFDELALERVAVRSSAIAEDSKTASWAGQLESYLNSTRDSLVGHIEKCWHSVKSERARDYADDNNIAEDQRRVAVIVQAMVDSEVSGVMFTANPITQSRNEYLIEAVYGLCELLVQGEVTPESLRVNKLSKKVIERVPSRQLKMLTYQDGKNQVVKLSLDKISKELVDDALVAQLIGLASGIESHYMNTPQDIEWAVYKSKVYAIQSRPITTLPPVQANDIINTKVSVRTNPL